MKDEELLAGASTQPEGSPVSSQLVSWSAGPLARNIFLIANRFGSMFSLIYGMSSQQRLTVFHSTLLAFRGISCETGFGLSDYPPGR